MKVLYINYLFDKKYSSVGAAVHVEEFVNAAKKAGLNIHSYDLNRFQGEEQASQSKSRAWLKKRLSRYVGQLNALLSNVGYLRREWKIINAERPDALLVRYNLLNFSAVLVAKIKKIPLVLEVNSPMSLENRRFNKKTWNLPLIPEWIELLNLKLASRVYTVSTALKSYFVEKGIEEKKISVVPNGVDVDAFRPDVNGVDIRQKYSLKDKTVIGFIGSFHYWHGVDCFENYVERIAGQYSDVSFLLVGDGPLRADLEKKFEGKGLAQRVVFTGYIVHEDIPRYLTAMDIVVAPYPRMTFFYFSPLKLFEYMAAGKAVIASRVGQIAEVVEDGVNGVLYEPGNVDQLVSKTVELLENSERRQRIGNQARDMMCRNYSWEINARSVIKLIDESQNRTNAR